MGKFVSLHHHSTFSYMDGYGTPEQHVARAAEMGMPAMALTEHGNVSSHVRLEKAGLKAGVKPIFGVELYTGGVEDDTKSKFKWHLTVLAETQKGYQNLLRIVSRGWAEGFYYEPTVSGEMLMEHNEGLIVTSGCSGSKLVCDLLGGKGVDPHDADVKAAIATAKKFQAVFGDRYYLEAQTFPELERTRQTNDALLHISAKTGIPIVATGDVHYPHESDNEMQALLHAAGRGGKNGNTVEKQMQSWGYDVHLTPRSDKEIIQRLVASGMSRTQAKAALMASAEIGARCNVTLPKAERVRYPLAQEPGWEPGTSAEAMLRKWLNEGWNYRGINKMDPSERERYKERVKHELALIVDKDFVDYFLMVSDVVRHCKDNQIPVGPARGSAAASLVCYLLRITEVDPMKFQYMLFERFIDPNRHDLPDIDLDFDDELRDECRLHLIRRYGEEKVGNIGTFTKYKGKNSIDDVARVYNIPKYEIDTIKTFLVERSGGDSRADASLMDTIELFPAVKAAFEKNPELYKAVDLEGNYKGMGVHAAGVVVSSEPLNNFVATYSRTTGKDKRQLSVLSVDKYDGEYLGLLKGDFLGLSTMGMIRIALGLIGMTLEELYQIPMDDPETLKAFSVADVVGIFQFEGRTTKMVCEEVAPTTFMELADINALSRPGPLHSGSTGDYIAAKNRKAEPEFLHKIVDDMTEATYGQIIYQEQILQICRSMGQFPWTDMGQIRKVISQKMGEAAFQNWYEMFEEGAVKQGISPRTADKVWKKLVTAGTYAFNVAHCISYSMLGFWCMWLKVHHPLAFYAAQLQKTAADDKGKDIALMRDISDERFGRTFQILPPDLNASAITWTADYEARGVRAGYTQIPGIGESYAKAILEYRDEVGGFDSWEDLINVRGIGPAKMNSIREFCNKRDPFGLGWIKENAKAIRDEIWEGELQGQVPMPDTLSDKIPYDAKRSEHTIMGVIKAINTQDMFENHRSRTGEDLDPKTVKDAHLKDSCTLYMEDEAGLITVKIDRWKYPKMRDQIFGTKLRHDFVLMKVLKRPFYGKTVHCQEMWVINPDE